MNAERTSTLVQLHWQNRDDFDQTIFVAQGEFGPDSSPTATEWAAEVCRRRIAEMPEGWTPLVLTQDDDRFVWANPQTARAS